MRSCPFLLGAAGAVCVLTSVAPAAEKVVATVSGADFDVSGGPVVQQISFNAAEPITGVGFTAQWTAVVADEEDGLFPWSLDLEIDITAPGGAKLHWAPIGGDRTIADYPLDDFSEGFAGVSGDGEFLWSFRSTGPPWTAGLRNVEYHLTTEVPDVVGVFTGSVAEGPMWNRPFFIAGISGLGPVVYHAMDFHVPVSGGYRVVSVVPQGNNFAYLYKGGFDPEEPLENLLDYGLGNGFAPNGSPQGTSWIDAMLFAGEQYTLVVSQWAFNTPGQPFENTITGPAAIIPGAVGAPGDLNGDGFVNGADLAALLANWGACADPESCPADLTGDDMVNGADLATLLANWSS